MLLNVSQAWRRQSPRVHRGASLALLLSLLFLPGIVPLVESMTGQLGGRVLAIGLTVPPIVEPAIPSDHASSPQTHPSQVTRALPANRQIASRLGPTASAALVIVGDVMLGRQVNIEMAKRGDYTWPFHETADLLQSADLTLANLETPVVSGCPFSDEGTVFCADPRAVEGLAWAGIDGVSLANNHAYTYKEAGLKETIDYLRQVGVEPIPAGTLMVREIDGIRIGAIAFNDSEAPLDLGQAAAAVNRASRQVDVLIGLVHWGQEYQAGPTARQREAGHVLIEAGLDIIAGAHPHWIQPVEEYQDGLIVYSLGNFVFDQTWSQETRLGEAIRLRLIRNASGIDVSYELIPIEIRGYGQPSVIQ
jgi:hypothetical protein